MVGKLEVNNEASRFGIEIVDENKKSRSSRSKQSAIYERMISERVREAKKFRAKGRDGSKIRAEADKEKTVILAEATKKEKFQG